MICSRIRSVFSFLALAAVLATGNASPARADCMESCLGRHDCDADYDDGRIRQPNNECRVFLDDCEDQCAGSDGDNNIYGAIAVDKDAAAWGLADPSPDENAAKNSALAACSKNGPNCAVIETFSRTCIGVASATGKVRPSSGRKPRRSRTRRSRPRKTVRTSPTIPAPSWHRSDIFHKQYKVNA